MKILLVITGMTMGGAEKVVADLADAFVGAGDEVLLVYLKGPMEVRPRRPEVDKVCLGMDSFRGVLGGAAKFRKLLREFQPDIVHSHMFHATLLARLMRLVVPMPCMISTMHSALDGGRTRPFVYRATDRLTEISTNVSVEAVDVFVASGAVRDGRMLAIHNGIAVDKFRPSATAREAIRSAYALDEGCKLFVAAGRLGWSKDYPNMFNALVRLPADLPFKLLIAGGGQLREELERMVQDLGLSDRVHFLGIREDIADLMSAADVFVLSSVGEGFGLVVAEAMACECVVVATDSGGVREVLGDAGFLVPTQDPEELAKALLKATSLTKAEAIEMGRAARRRVVDTYSFNRAVEKWRELYGSFVKGAGRQVNESRTAG